MLRNIGAVVAGIVVGGIVNMGLVIAAALIWPMPDGAMEDPVVLKAYVAALPATALLWVMGAHLAQAGLGGWVAARVSTAPIVAGLILGALTAVGTAINLADLGGPVWMWLELPVDVALGGGVGWLEIRRRGR